MQGTRALIVLNALTSLILLAGCSAQVPAIFESTDFPEGINSCLYMPVPGRSFKIQCQAFVSFYLSFKDARSGHKLDLRQHVPTVRLLDAEGKVRYDSAAPDAGKLQLRQNSELEIDYTGFYLREHLFPSGKLTLEVSFKGYKPLSRTLTVEDLADDSQRTAYIPEFEFSLEPA